VSRVWGRAERAKGSTLVQDSFLFWTAFFKEAGVPDARMARKPRKMASTGSWMGWQWCQITTAEVLDGTGGLKMKQRSAMS